MMLKIVTIWLFRESLLPVVGSEEGASPEKERHEAFSGAVRCPEEHG